MERIRLEDKLEQIDDYWHPHIIGELNGQHVKLAKLKGPFVWHHHDDADELFLVLRGHLTMRLRDRTVELAKGDCFIVPRGVEHQPVAREETAILLFEPAGTVNTGNVRDEHTIERLKKI